MMRCVKSAVLAAAVSFGALLSGTVGTVRAEEGTLPGLSWHEAGPFGTIDQAQARRGFETYQEVCSACHGMKLVPFRALQGIGFTADQVQQIAADWPYQVDGDPDDEGKVVKRPLRPADRIIGPFANDQAARFHMGGVVPPDLSVIVKARQGGEDYIANLLVGYRDPPPDGFTLIDGRSYNTYFPGHQIAMPPLLQDDTDNAADGSKTTALQKAQDVAVFLSFVADPTQDERKALGFRVILFLLVVTGLLYLCKRAVWHNVR